MWYDKDGVLYSKSKQQSHVQTREERELQMQEFKKLTGGQKKCLILETNHSAPMPRKEERDWIASELEKITRAMAVIATSPLSRMMANLFFGFKPASYPVKFFSNEKDAKEWIKQYL